MAHTHHWVELRRQIPWTEHDFDPDVLAPERARHTDGTPHSDKEHAAKVAKPRPEIVFYCAGCTSTKPFEIPVKRYTQIVAQLESGELSDARGADAITQPNDITLVPLALLVPEAVKELTDETDALMRAGFTATDTGIVATIGLEGKAAEDADTRLREHLGLPPLDYVHATHPVDRTGVKS